MGDPRRLKRKYSEPAHPWQATRIKEEKELLKEYGLKNKTEIWKATSKLKNFANQAKKLIALTGKQAEKETIQLLNKLKKLGLLKEEAQLSDVLGLTARAILERRLQTLVYKKGLARSVKQARQFITHRHILVNGKKITAPGYIVPKKEENITFEETSSLANEEHPERIQTKKEIKKETEKEEKKSKEPTKKTTEQKTEKKENTKKKQKKKKPKTEKKKEPEQKTKKEQ